MRIRAGSFTFDGGRPLAVVEDGEFPEGLPRPHPPQHLPLLDHLVLALRRHVQMRTYSDNQIG